MAKITFPCGCEINAAFTLAMCPQHYHELKQQEAEAERDFKQFEDLMRGADRASAGG